MAMRLLEPLQVLHSIVECLVLASRLWCLLLLLLFSLPRILLLLLSLQRFLLSLFLLVADESPNLREACQGGWSILNR
jgi:hypothetical protein